MLVISIPSYELWLQPKKIEENFNGRAIFVIVVVNLNASFNHIYGRQKNLASNIF